MEEFCICALKYIATDTQPLRDIPMLMCALVIYSYSHNTISTSTIAIANWALFIAITVACVGGGGVTVSIETLFHIKYIHLIMSACHSYMFG